MQVHNTTTGNYDFISLKYKKWQSQFFLERLETAIRVVIIAYPIIILLLALIGSTFQLIFGERPEYQLFIGKWNWDQFIHFLLVMNVPELCLIVCLFSLKHQKLSANAERIFLFFSFALTIMPQFEFIRIGLPPINPIPWLIMFPTQAMLIPVRWQSHFLSQFLFMCWLFLGFGIYEIRIILKRNNASDILSKVPADTFHRWLILVTMICLTYALGVCFIGFASSFGVFLYERTLRAEFEYRQRIQLFLHAVSHDLRNPVIGMGMLLKMLLDETRIEARSERVMVDVPIIERLLENSERQLKLIDSLMEIHKIETQGISISRQASKLKFVVELALNDIQPMLAKHQAKMLNQISVDLPLVEVDINQLLRVYQNLICNALKHNPQGVAIVLTAEVIFKQNSQWLYCTVTDDGVGINYNNLENIFNPYFSGNKNKESTNLGLGLYICQEIIHAHGGQIGVFVSSDRGTTFWFILPVKI
jgi:signal transduction histidine kinase